MSGNKYSKLFDPKQESMHLSYIYFSYCDKVKQEDQKELYDAYIAASDIAETREFEEAIQGIYR